MDMSCRSRRLTRARKGAEVVWVYLWMYMRTWDARPDDGVIILVVSTLRHRDVIHTRSWSLKHSRSHNYSTSCPWISLLQITELRSSSCHKLTLSFSMHTELSLRRTDDNKRRTIIVRARSGGEKCRYHYGSPLRNKQVILLIQRVLHL